MSTVRLSDAIKEQVRRVADAKGCTVSEVHRRALEEYCRRELSAARTSRWDDIIGTAEGPSDLSTRASDYFAEALKQKHRRGGHPG